MLRASICFVAGVHSFACRSIPNPTARRPGQSSSTCNAPLITTLTASHLVALARPASVSRLKITAPAKIAPIRQTLSSTLARAGSVNFSWTFKMPPRNAAPQISTTYGSMIADSTTASRQSGRSMPTSQNPPSTNSPSRTTITSITTSRLTLPRANSRACSVCPPRRSTCSIRVYIGIKAAESAPSPKSLRNRLGSVNANVNAAQIGPAPK